MKKQIARKAALAISKGAHSAAGVFDGYVRFCTFLRDQLTYVGDNSAFLRWVGDVSVEAAVLSADMEKIDKVAEARAKAAVDKAFGKDNGKAVSQDDDQAQA